MYRSLVDGDQRFLRDHAIDLGDALNDVTPEDVLAIFRGKPLHREIIEGDVKIGVEIPK